MFRRLLLIAACAFPAAAHADWQEASSKHFVVYSNDSAENVKAVTVRLERFDRAVRLALQLKDPEVGPDARVIVFVLPGISDVQKMMGDKRTHVAGFYNDDYPSGPFAFVPRNNPTESERDITPLAILQHEYTHHIMYSNWGDVVFPTWFSEGFAELFATAETRADGSVFIGKLPAYRLYGIDKMNDYPVEKLVVGGPDYHDGMQTQIFYGRSWLLTHYLMFNPARAKQLAAYITAVNDGKSPDEANKLLGISSSLDLKLNSYGSHPIPAATFTAGQLPISDVTVRPLTPGEAATMEARMRSHNGVDSARAQTVVAMARQGAANFPDDAGAQNELAEAEYDAGNFAASEAAADRARAAAPGSVHALIYKGMALMALAEKAGNTDPVVWTAARRWFLAANKADPLYSYPVQLYYESFRTAAQTPTKAAKDGLIYAYRLSPQNAGLRLETAQMLLGDGNAKAARVALEPIAYSAHGSPLADLAKKAIGALDSGGPPAAIAVFEEARAKDKADADNAKDKARDKGKDKDRGKAGESKR